MICFYLPGGGRKPAPPRPYNARVMNYGIAYSRFIGGLRRRKRLPPGRIQLHHVTPRSLGGGEDVVQVTEDEHEYAHFLLNMALFQKGRARDLEKVDYGYRPQCFRIARNRAFRALRVLVEDAEGSVAVPLAEAGRRLASLVHTESAAFPREPARKCPPGDAYKFATRVLFRATRRDGRYFNFRFSVLAGENRPLARA